MLTKEQKKKLITETAEEIGKNNILILADFSGVPTGEINKLRTILRGFGAKFRVVKKRLLKIAFQQKGIDYDPTQFEKQAGAIWLTGDIFEGAGKIYGFVKDLAKAKKEFKILGGYDLADKKAITAEEFTTIAKLPSREVLLTQIAVMLTMPLRQIMVALNERVKKI